MQPANLTSNLQTTHSRCCACRDKLRQDYWAVQRRGWRVWPLASWINQQFVPLQASWGRVTLGSCAVGLCIWQHSSWPGVCACASPRSMPLALAFTLLVPSGCPPSLQLRVVVLNLVALGWTTSLLLSARTAPKLLKAA